MPIPVGTVIQVDYDLTVDDKLLETTNEAKSKENGLHQDGRVYRPYQYIHGVGGIIPGLEENVASVVDRQVPGFVTDPTVHHIEVPPEQAYGQRNPKNIQFVPTAQLRGQKVEAGSKLRIGPQEGTVMRMAGGRVMVDMNHDFAGKTLVYDYVVRAVLTDPKQKVETLIDRVLGPEATHDWSDDNHVLTVDIPSMMSMSPQWPQHRFTLVRQLRLVLQNDEPLIRLVEYFDPPPKPTPPPMPEMVPPAPSAEPVPNNAIPAP